MRRRKYLVGFMTIALLMLTGCYIPSGMHRLTYKVTRIDPDGTECNVDLTKKRSDGWTIITCPGDESKQSRPEETE